MVKNWCYLAGFSLISGSRTVEFEGTFMTGIFPIFSQRRRNYKETFCPVRFFHADFSATSYVKRFPNKRATFQIKKFYLLSIYLDVVTCTND